MSQEIVDAIRDIARERGIEPDALLDALEDGLLAAYKKLPDAARHSFVEVDEQGDYHVYAYQLPPELEERLLDEARERRYDEIEALEAETGEKQANVLVDDDELELDWSQVPDADLTREDVTPEGFGRIAAMTAKQIFSNRLRSAQREVVYEDYKDRIGEAVLGIVQQVDPRAGVYLDLGQAEALLPKSEQVQGERYEQGNRVRAVVVDVRTETSGPQIILSRRDGRLVAAMFELEVPEVADGTIEIVNVARDPGVRSKIAVISHSSSVDPVGACVGPRGARVRPIVSELRGEKIDIIPYQGDSAKMIARALQPAQVKEVYVDEDAKEAVAIVAEDQRAFAIGREGSNVRLAARLTGWKIDVQSDKEFAEEAREASGVDDASRCAAVLSSGKRCPNTALPGSRYCGIPAHQELVNQPTPTLAEEAAAVGADPADRAEMAQVRAEMDALAPTDSETANDIVTGGRTGDIDGPDGPREPSGKMLEFAAGQDELAAPVES
jgi:N utilization substance protein A